MYEEHMQKIKAGFKLPSGRLLTDKDLVNSVEWITLEGLKEAREEIFKNERDAKIMGFNHDQNDRQFQIN